MSDDATTADSAGDGLGHDPERDDLAWHALNYRTAHTMHAEAMWQELTACVDRRVAAAVAAERERRIALAAAFQEYLYRVASQVPFEHAGWANERGAALLAALRDL